MAGTDWNFKVFPKWFVTQLGFLHKSKLPEHACNPGQVWIFSSLRDHFRFWLNFQEDTWIDTIRMESHGMVGQRNPAHHVICT